MATATIGIDLGPKDFSAFSNGQKIESLQFYRDLEPVLAVAQRANKKERVIVLSPARRARTIDVLQEIG